MDEPPREPDSDGPGGAGERAPVGEAPRARRSEVGLLLLVVVLCVAPFSGRALDVDGPLFAWVARQVARRPADPFGFEVNWYGFAQPMAEVTKNPPLHSYGLALFGAPTGWSDFGLHLFPLAMALAAALGIHALARRLCARPALAAFAAVLTPAFLVSSTTVMSDVTLLAAWVWTLVLWERGLARRSARILWLAMLCAAAAALTKYFGLALLPLVAAWALARRARPALWLLPLLLPLAALAAWDVATRGLYGRGLVLEAIVYSARTRAQVGAGVSGGLVISLAFLGGATASVLALGPWLVGRAGAVVLGALGLGLGLIVALAPESAQLWLASPATPNAAQAAQLGLWAAVGLGAVLLVAADLRRARDADALLLALWVLGTLFFAVGANWTVNVRGLLPAVPALAILAARRIETSARAPRAGALVVALGASGLLSLLLCQAGARHAGVERLAARTIAAEHGSGGQTIWFQGHWGFQYYAQELGMRTLSYESDVVRAGDLVVLPLANTNVLGVPPEITELVATLELPVSPWFTLQRGELNAGFHSSGWGPLPFALGPVPPLRYRVWRARADFGYR